VADLVSFDSSRQNHIVLRKATRYTLVKKRAKYTLDLSPEMAKRPIGF
jgi:hypothetical protein